MLKEYAKNIFFERFPMISDILKSENPRSLLQSYFRNLWITQSQSENLAALELSPIKDAVAVWDNFLLKRYEESSSFSLLSFLVREVHGKNEGSEAFWADLYHITLAAHGGSDIYRFSAIISEKLVGREAALKRSESLDEMQEKKYQKIMSYMSSLMPENQARRENKKREILEKLGGSLQDWENWHWHLKHIAQDFSSMENLVILSEEEKEALLWAEKKGIPFGITPYYASLLYSGERFGLDMAARSVVLPTKYYVESFQNSSKEDLDFMKEYDTSPIDLITRRYASIVILKPYNACPQICVYCQRNWEIEGPMASHAMASQEDLEKALKWIEEHHAIREVLVTGGDPMVLSNDRLKFILERLSQIEHIERIRIGTRTLVTLPMRFDEETCHLLASFRLAGKREICIVTHVEHISEITDEMVKACDKIRKMGISIYNQHVYMAFVSRRFEAAALRRALRKIGIDPYYLFYPKGKNETAKYRVPIARIMQEQKEEARILPGMTRTDEPVYNVPGLGKNKLNATQHREFISLKPDGSRIYEFHPWEKNITMQKTYIGGDVPILDYLKRLETFGEKRDDYRTIWYYY